MAYRDEAWAQTLKATAHHWAALEHLSDDDKQVVTGLAQECFGQGVEAGYNWPRSTEG